MCGWLCICVMSNIALPQKVKEQLLDLLISWFRSCRSRWIRGQVADRRAWRWWAWTFADSGCFWYQIWQWLVAAHFCHFFSHRHFEFANSNRRPATWGSISNSNFGSWETQCCLQPSSPRTWNPDFLSCCCRTTCRPGETNCPKISLIEHSFPSPEEAYSPLPPLFQTVALCQTL